jgi:CheY-like chemotaxis protein
MGTILVVDDDPYIRTVMSTILHRFGYAVVTARDGSEALSLFTSDLFAIDLIITDLKMPVLDGYELIRRIRELRPDVAVVCMSGYPDHACPEGIRYLPKPFTFEQVRKCVDEAMAASVA